MMPRLQTRIQKLERILPPLSTEDPDDPYAACSAGAPNRNIGATRSNA